MVFLFHNQRYLIFIAIFSLLLTFAAPSLAATTQLHIVKYANDRTTILSETTLTYQEMESSLPVQGDGSTHYFLQGPVFVDNIEQRWNPGEDTNVQEKDMGAVKGTDIKDLCNLVGGMSQGDTLTVKASDGLTKEFAYKNIYSPPSRQGPMVITWYKDGLYPDTGYEEGLRLLFFADDSVNPWKIHAMGNYDWHESADQQFWYYYQNGNEKYPTTTGLSVKYVSDLLIYSSLPASSIGSGSWGWNTGLSRPAGAAPADDASQYGYRGSKLITYDSGALNGSIRLFYDPNSTPKVVNNRIQDYTIPLDLPPGSNLTLARLYVYVSKSHGIQNTQGVIPSLHTQFNQQQLDAEKVYIDTDGDDHRNVSATYAYNVLQNLQGNGSYTISLRNLDYDQNVFSVDGVILLVAYEQDQGLYTQYWIDEGCDVILSEPKKGILPENAATSIAFTGTINTTENRDADLILVSTGIDAENTTEHFVKFNNEIWYNSFDNYSDSNILRIPVKPLLNMSGNSASIASAIRKKDADYLVNRNAILVIEQRNSTGADTEQELMNLTLDKSIFVNSSVPLNTSLISNSTSTYNISLHSDPEGALIFIDGIYQGKTTPFTFNINSSNEHLIRLELDGFIPFERNLSVMNNTIVCEHLYSDVYTTKGRSEEMVLEREQTRHGGLYINSRPQPAIISLDGIQMPQRTPAVINGLKEGTYTVRLSFELSDPYLREKSDIRFEDQEVYVPPYSIVPVDVVANSSPLREIIIDSRDLRGEPFTVNGRAIQKTIPDKITTPIFDSFITIFHNESYVSYKLPFTMNEDHYLLIEPRQHYNLSVFVDSSPRGAEVFIDGFKTGFSTPYTFFNISDGPHKIMVTKPGYIPQERSVNLLYTPVPLSTTNVHFTLDEYTNGFLRVASDPPGATISVDGSDTGEVTPFLFSSIPIGLHSVTVSGNNKTRMYPDITVNALATVNISANFHEISD
jgi:Protein of unknown function (DUF3344)/PEGA domain